MATLLQVAGHEVNIHLDAAVGEIIWKEMNDFDGKITN
jgi:hypothetical protein